MDGRTKKEQQKKSCACATWKQHWINNSGKPWPSLCSVVDCNNTATQGGHIINETVKKEIIVPICDVCNKRSDEFALKGGVRLVSSDQSETCVNNLS